MKLPDLKKTRLSTVSTYGVVSILGTAMVIIAIVAIAAIRGAGSYSLKTTKTAIKTEAVKLLQKNTKRKAEEYSEVFKQGLFYTSLVGDQINLSFNNMGKFDIPENVLINVRNRFKKLRDDLTFGFISKKQNWSIYYYGPNLNKFEKELYYIDTCKTIFRTILYTDTSYINIWFADYSNYIDVNYNKNIKPTLESIPNRTKAIDVFDKFYDIRLHDKKTYISDLYKDLYHDYIVLTIGANYVPDNEKYGFVFAVDILFNTITNDILQHNIPFIEGGEKKGNVKLNNSFIIEKNKGGVLAMSDNLYLQLKLPRKDIKKLRKAEGFNVTLNQSKLKTIRDFANSIGKNSNGIENIFIDGEEYLFCFYKMSIKDWVFGVVVPTKDLYKAVEETEARMGVTVMGFIINFVMVAIFFMFILLIVVILFFKTYLVKPIVSFRDNVLKMGEGDLETPIKEKGVYEISVLANSFNSLRVDLKSHMDDFKVEISHKQRRENELKTARQVQLSVLPKLTSLFKNRGIELYAKLLPAIDVAGDYYDFFYVGVNKLILIIADVSGKGISASFFMAVTKRTLRNTCINEPDDPAKSIDMANKILCGYNINMFVTLFLIYYDMETGEIKFANGGHNEAVCLKENGTVDVFGCLNNAALGCFPDLPFGKAEYKLQKGDTLYLYTDGIVEANKGDENFYGMDRFTDLLIKNRKKSVAKICKAAIQDVHLFEEGGQFDDITILAIKRE